MEDINANQGNGTEREIPDIAYDERFLRYVIREALTELNADHLPQGVWRDIVQRLFHSTEADELSEIWNEEFVNLYIRSEINFNETSLIPFRITEEPLTPLNLALTLIYLTELVTELWLIGKHRFADLVEYIQTHDVRFLNEAGITIAWITYNSPVNIGLSIDKVFTGLANALMTVINGVTQRKARLQKLELENQALAQQIEEARQRAYDASKMEELHRKERELHIMMQQWEVQNKVGAAFDIETGITIMLPIEDAATKSMLRQLVLPTVLQLSHTKGLELDLGIQTYQKDSPKEDAG